MRRWFRRLFYLLRQSHHDAELRAEMEAHRALRQAHLEREGLSVSEAEEESRRALGAALLAREEAREAWLGAWDAWWQDVRYGLRMIRRSPGVAVVVILTMAVGIGMNAAMFGLFHAVILRPLPYPDAERLVWLTNHHERFAIDTMVSRADFMLWRERARSFERMAAYGEQALALGAADQTREERVLSIAGDYWAITGARASRGRLFAADEQDAIVLSHDTFERRFNADPSAIGRSVTLNGSPVTVVGVLGRDALFALPGMLSDPRPPAAYLLLPDLPTPPGQHDVAPAGRVPVPPWVRVVGKVKAGVTIERARGEMQTIHDLITRDHPHAVREGRSLRVVSLQRKVVGPVEVALTVLLVAVAFVLLIATTNIAHLLLARALSRRTELAIRVSLGAGRTRIIRQLLLESLLLACVGCAAGLVLAHWALQVVVRLWPQAMPRLDGAGFNAWVLAFALAAAFVSTALFGAVPGLSLSRSDLMATLRREDRSSSPPLGVARLRAGLVGLELALATALLIGAGLMIKSFWLMNARPPGLDPDRILVARVSLSGPRYAARAPQEQYAQELLRRLGGAPGIEAVGLDAGSYHVAIAVGGLDPQPAAKAADARQAFATLKPVSLGFLRVMGVPLLRGTWPTDRAMASDAVESTDALLVNQRFVDVVMRGADPIGRHIRGPYVSGTVAGVVADFKDGQLDAEPLAQVYVPFTRAMLLRSVRLVLRVGGGGDPSAAVPFLRDTIAQMDRTQAIAEFATLGDILTSSVSNRHFSLSMLCLFAAVALFLALTGAYGVIAHSVAQRSREIGIRIALGATPSAVVRQVVRHEMRVAFAGIALGLLGAFALAPVMASAVYGVPPRDPVTFVVGGVALALAALLTSWRAAARAARVDPIVVLQG